MCACVCVCVCASRITSRGKDRRALKRESVGLGERKKKIFCVCVVPGYKSARVLKFCVPHVPALKLSDDAISETGNAAFSFFQGVIGDVFATRVPVGLTGQTPKAGFISFFSPFPKGNPTLALAGVVRVHACLPRRVAALPHGLRLPPALARARRYSSVSSRPSAGAERGRSIAVSNSHGPACSAYAFFF